MDNINNNMIMVVKMKRGKLIAKVDLVEVNESSFYYIRADESVPRVLTLEDIIEAYIINGNDRIYLIEQ